MNESSKANLSTKMTSKSKQSPIVEKSSKIHTSNGRRPFSWLETGSKNPLSKHYGNIINKNEFDFVASSTRNSTPNSSPLLK